MSVGEKIIFMDIDLSVSTSSVYSLVKALEKYDVVVGSRYHPRSESRRTLLRLIIGRAYGFLPRIVFGINIRDFQCGFKGFRRNAALTLIRYTTSPGVFWDTEMLFLSKKLGFKILETPVSWIEKKTRVTKIGIKTICNFSTSVTKLFFYNLLNRDSCLQNFSRAKNLGCRNA